MYARIICIVLLLIFGFLAGKTRLKKPVAYPDFIGSTAIPRGLYKLLVKRVFLELPSSFATSILSKM